MSDEMIVEHCSPTLAGIKTGNLFSCECSDRQCFLKEICRLNRVLAKKGINAIPVRYSDNRVLIYVFRPAFLAKDFKDNDTASLLEELGYEATDVRACVRCLSKKLFNLSSSKEFPHEIGLFLGYPVDDVKGFMKYKGECSKCTGRWKVYGDVERAKQTFDKYDKCTRDYKKRFRAGTSLDSLTVYA